MFESSRIDVSGIRDNVVAIDFGASNTDAAAIIDGKLRVWSEGRKGMPSLDSVHAILAAGDIAIHKVRLVAVTGGHHQILPETIDEVPFLKIGELTAIGRGGQALATGTWRMPSQPMLIVSAGSGTAMVAARVMLPAKSPQS